MNAFVYISPSILEVFSLIVISNLYFVRRTSHPSLVLFIIIDISFVSDLKKKKSINNVV